MPLMWPCVILLSIVRWLPCCILLCVCGLLFAVGGSPVAACAERWKRDENLASLYLRMNTWGDDSLQAEKIGHLFYDLHATLLLLARGASFMRLPDESEDGGGWKALHHVVRDHLLSSLRVLGGFPERSGVCVAAPDVTSKQWKRQYRTDAIVRSTATATATRIVQTLPPGRYCHSLALDRRSWDDLQVSRFEIQEAFARDLVQGRRVLILRGTARGAPDDQHLQEPLRFAQSVVVLHVSTSLATDNLHNLVEDIQLLLSQVDMLLLMGLPVGVGAVLTAEATCGRYGVQTLDVGDFAMDARSLSRPPIAIPPSLRPLSLNVVGALSSRSFAGSRRPQLLRLTGDVLDLNGEWEVLITYDQTQLIDLPAEPWAERIRVPFAPQALQGLATKVAPTESVWYRRQVQVPQSWCDGAASRVHLHVDACDWDCQIFLEGHLLGRHQGGYDPFTLPLILEGGTACRQGGVQLIIRAWDPTDAGCEFVDTPPMPCDACCEFGWQPRGKQSLKPNLIMYTGVTGLWRQGVWLERTSPCYIADVAIDVEPSAVNVHAAATCGTSLQVIVRVRGTKSGIGSTRGACCAVRVELTEALRPWSPQEPMLYEAVLDLDGVDVVTHSFARREIVASSGRMLLNGVQIFMHGVLYQGYWPDSLMTPPTPESVEQDLRAIKEAGFNTVRVHAVVMGAAFYSLCDTLGLLVWQDMPAGDSRATPAWEKRRGEAEAEAAAMGFPGAPSLFDEIKRTRESQRVFHVELQAMVSWLRAFPSIIVWVLFNEGWGQSQTQPTVAWLREVDPTRLVDASSGWNDIVGHPLGHFADLHNYETAPFGDLSQTFMNWPFQDYGRVRVLGEYGGLGYIVPGHEWAVGSAWAYGKKVAKDADAFRDAFEALMDRLLTLLCAGLGAAIYTQWNDVETEANGLLTYNRQPKLPLELLRHHSERIQLAASQCAPANG